MRALNRVARDEPALWERDFDQSGFRWIDADDADHNLYAFARFDASGKRVVVCVANLADAAWSPYRVGLPRGGLWVELLDTAGPSRVGAIHTEPLPWNGLPQSVALDLAPLEVIWLAHRDDGAADTDG